MADDQFKSRDDIRWEEENQWSIWNTGYDLFTTHEKRIPFMGGHVDGSAGLFMRHPLPDPETKCFICEEPTADELCILCIFNLKMWRRFAGSDDIKVIKEWWNKNYTRSHKGETHVPHEQTDS